MAGWLPAYAWDRLHHLGAAGRGVEHILLAVADHFEPSFSPDPSVAFEPRVVQLERMRRWCRVRTDLLDKWRDADGCPLRHTFFYPAEQYDAEIVEMLADHCAEGWGEVEVQLHHGLDHPDTEEHTRQSLLEFRDRLAKLGCLSRWDGLGPPAYAFVHGNWALANSEGGRCCGVDSEMAVLAETGCYADFTLPSAPSRGQVAKVNCLYECELPLDRAVPHRCGRNLQVGRPPSTFPLMVTGPLLVDLSAASLRRPWPRIENGELTVSHPPTTERLEKWLGAGIRVQGRPQWAFLKLHCHGMDPRDEELMLGPLLTRFLEELVGEDGRYGGTPVHFVTAREMVNIALAACDGETGDPGHWRNYRLRLMGEERATSAPDIPLCGATTNSVRSSQKEGQR